MNIDSQIQFISARRARSVRRLIGAAMLIVAVGCSPSESTDTSVSDNGGPSSSADASSDTDADPATDAKIDTTVPQAGQVLRHAVFFKFKDDTTEEQIQTVVDAFRALPTKIPEIIGFEWGVNNSPEGKDDGFTHCFLLTFADDIGRAIYLPHEAHKAFGDVLRPHMEDVFVVDYWGTPSKVEIENPLRHVVFFKFQEDAPAEGIEAVEQGFAALPDKIDVIKDFEWGKNNSPESHDDGFTHCFLVTFASEADRAVYLPHEAHLEFIEVVKPVIDSVRVLDFTAQK